ncbi:MAG: hypothetical protein ACFFCT_06030 [Candidatus Odinarchaeota archaeon]
MPNQDLYLTKAELIGLDEIRVALKEVEKLRQNGIDARVEILDCDDDSSLRVTLRSFSELQEFITQRYSRMLTDGITSAIPLDDFEQLVSETRIRLLDDTQRIRGRMMID